MTEDKVERALEALKEKQAAIIADLKAQMNHYLIFNSTYKKQNRILYLQRLERYITPRKTKNAEQKRISELRIQLKQFQYAQQFDLRDVEDPKLLELEIDLVTNALRISDVKTTGNTDKILIEILSK
jgi:hypothetical protein